jgi:hypothetical protein
LEFNRQKKMERRSRHLLFAVLAVVLTVSASSMGGGLTTPDAAAGVAGATASGLFNIRPLSIFTGHCNASIARGATIWKPIPGVVDIFFPKVVSVPRLPFLLHYLMCVCVCSSLLFLPGIQTARNEMDALDDRLPCWALSPTTYCLFRIFFFFFCMRFHFLPSWKCPFFSSWQQLPRPGKKKSIQTNGSCESIK